MAHDRDAAPDQTVDGFRHVPAAFELDALAADFGHHPGAVAEGLGRRFLVAAERHIDDDAGRLGAAHHGLAVGDHHVEGNAQRAVQAVQHHAQAVADQQQVDMRVEQAGDRRRIGGQTDHRRAALARADIGCGQPPAGSRRIALDAHIAGPASARIRSRGHSRAFCCVWKNVIDSTNLQGAGGRPPGDKAFMASKTHRRRSVRRCRG